jgi:hypothetical protein
MHNWVVWDVNLERGSEEVVWEDGWVVYKTLNARLLISKLSSFALYPRPLRVLIHAKLQYNDMLNQN